MKDPVYYSPEEVDLPLEGLSSKSVYHDDGTSRAGLRLTRGWRFPLAFAIVGVLLGLSILLAAHATSLKLFAVDSDGTIATDLQEVADEVARGNLDLSTGDVLDGELLRAMDDASEIVVFSYVDSDTFCLLGTNDEGRVYTDGAWASYDTDARGVDGLGGACDPASIESAGYVLGKPGTQK